MLIKKEIKMKISLCSFVSLIWLSAWIAGVVIAKGILITLTAIVFPPFAWYLIIEKIMILNGIAS